MVTIELIITILIVLVVTLLFYTSSKILVKSAIDREYYFVKPGKMQQKTADVLGEINKRINILIDSLELNNENNRLVKSRYKRGNLTENIDLSQTSYTVNKGSEVAICVTTRNIDETIYDINLLMFVSIHELAHIGCVSTGHNDEFINFFKFLLNKAISKGIYKFDDYSKYPKEYCGMVIKTTPIN